MRSYSKTMTLFGVALTVTIVAVCAYAFFFIAMRSKTEETATLLARLKELSGKESQVTSATAVLKSEGSHIEKLSTYFIKESEIVAFTKAIEALGPQSGTTITIVSLDPGVTEKTAPFLNLRIKATGKFADVMRVLTLLDNFPGEFEWKSVRVTRDDTPVQQTGATAPKIEQTPEWTTEVFISALNFVKE